MSLFCAAWAARPLRAAWVVLRLVLTAALASVGAAQASPGSLQATHPEQPVSSGQMPGEMDLAAYLAELDRVSSAASRLTQNPAEIPAVRASLPKAWPVRLAGQRFEVSTSWLDSALETMETSPAVRASLQKDIQKRLSILREQEQSLEQGSAGTNPDQARARLDTILGRREFRFVQEPNWWERAKARFWQKVGQFLLKFFGRLGGSRRSREFVVWGLIALAFVLLVLWVRRVLQQAARAKGLELSVAFAAGKTWRDWAREALGAAARHDYREAVHRAYWAGVYRLADLGTWQLDRARTPREYLRLLAREAAAPTRLAAEGSVPAAGQAERAAALAALTRNLETTWYGYRPATADDFRAALSHLEALGCQFPSNVATASS